jgi:hypothetical protein
MSLPASQRRALGSIEGRLRAADPHLASMFAIFARLNVGEPVAAEHLAFRFRLRLLQPRLSACAAVLIPVMFIAMVVLSALASGPRTGPGVCEGDHSVGGVSPLVRSACRLTADTTAVTGTTTVKARSVTTPDDTENPACITVALHGRSARGWVCYK